MKHHTLAAQPQAASRAHALEGSASILHPPAAAESQSVASLDEASRCWCDPIDWLGS